MEQQILRHVDDLVIFIKKQSPFVYETFRHQQLVEAYTNIAFFAIAVLCAILLTAVVYFLCRHANTDDEDLSTAWIIVGLVASVVLFVFGVTVIHDSVIQLLNPDYFAIRDLAWTFKP